MIVLRETGSKRTPGVHLRTRSTVTARPRIPCSGLGAVVGGGGDGGRAVLAVGFSLRRFGLGAVVGGGDGGRAVLAVRRSDLGAVVGGGRVALVVYQRLRRSGLGAVVGGGDGGRAVLAVGFSLRRFGLGAVVGGGDGGRAVLAVSFSLRRSGLGAVVGGGGDFTGPPCIPRSWCGTFRREPPHHDNHPHVTEQRTTVRG